MTLFDWRTGLFIVIGIPLAVFVVAVFWPQRMPKRRSVQAIRERVDQDGAQVIETGNELP
ncbi:hypothetical protein GZH49_12835 [Nocardia terpenica]|uniref:hypothetical protein n=1 Tax=Nocardia terpenica TaxID=455432 RepID=UPI002FE0C2CB